MHPRMPRLVSWIGLPLLMTFVFGGILPSPTQSSGGYGMPSLPSIPVPVTPGTSLINQGINTRNPGGKKKTKKKKDPPRTKVKQFVAAPASRESTGTALLRHEYMRDMVGNLDVVGAFAIQSLERNTRGLGASEVAEAQRDLNDFRSTMRSAMSSLEAAGGSGEDPATIDRALAAARDRSMRAYRALQGKPVQKVIDDLIRGGYFEVMSDLTSDARARNAGLIDPDEIDEASVDRAREHPGDDRADDMQMALGALELVSKHAEGKIEDGEASVSRPQPALRDIKKFVGGVHETVVALESAAATDNFGKMNAAVAEAKREVPPSLASLQSGPAGDLMSDYLGPKFGEMVSDLGS